MPVSWLSCSPYLKADKESHCLSKKISTCVSLWSPVGSGTNSARPQCSQGAGRDLLLTLCVWPWMDYWPCSLKWFFESEEGPWSTPVDDVQVILMHTGTNSPQTGHTQSLVPTDPPGLIPDTTPSCMPHVLAAEKLSLVPKCHNIAHHPILHMLFLPKMYFFSSTPLLSPLPNSSSL